MLSYEIERRVRIKESPYYCNVLDVGKTGTFTWKISKNDWSYREGEAMISLIFQRSLVTYKTKKEMSLKVKINAYTKVENDLKVNRLIKNWYYTTDEPFSSEARLWESGGPEAEYGLGALNIYPFEDLFIEITILNPDTELAKAMPRLKIVGTVDLAGVTWQISIVDGGLILCILLLIFMNVFIWKTIRS